MSEVQAPKRISKVAAEFGISVGEIVSFLTSKGFAGINPNSKVEEDQYNLLLEQYGKEKSLADAAHNKLKEHKEKKEELARAEITIESVKKAAVEQEQNILKAEMAKPEIIVPKEEPKPTPAPQVVTETNVEPPVIPQPEQLASETTSETIKATVSEDLKPGLVVKGKIDLEATKKGKKVEKTEPPPPEPPKTPEPVAEKITEPETPVKPNSVGDFIQLTEAEKAERDKATPEHYETKVDKLEGPKVLSTMDISKFSKDKKSVDPKQRNEDGKRARIKKSVDIGKVAQTQTGQPASDPRNRPNFNRPNDKRQNNNQNRNQPQRDNKQPLTEEQIQKQVKETLARLSAGGKSKSSKYRRDKREERRAEQAELEQTQSEKRIIQVTEFVTANELAKLMDVQVVQIISTCMALGMFVSINQRLDAETLTIVAEEFGFEVEFVSAEVQEAIKEEEDRPEELKERSPIVTVMGHVDHGKTSLLDYIRKANVIAGEAGGITQHIGAYNVELENGKHITFLDTPGHEAFTAMRARGAKVTDVVIVVVAADDSVMPQTREAINHAQAAGVPIVFAINKIDKQGANPDKIKEELANMNILVEDWGGKYQSQEISAKSGINIDKLLEKVLLEAELLDLKANPNRLANGTVIESSLDKGRGFISTVLVEKGTLKVGDVVLAGCYSGRVKALQNERGGNVKEAGPSMPVILLGLSGAPQAGDRFNVMEDEREARDIANKRLQLQREQGYRTRKHITLDEIGRRLAIGDFQELNLIVKGDVDGSVEALADSLIKLSTEKIQVNIVHKAVGQISESDIMLASASNAIIVGFQVRPSVSARKLAEQEQIDIRLYSIIYDAIEEVKAAMEGMLAPTMEEKVVCNLEVREVFKISKVGTIAGCMVLDGKINRQTRVRLIRDGIVVYNGNLGSLKRFKDDVKEVASGYECGLNIENFNDIKVGDIIEGYTQVEVKQKL